MMTMDDQRMAEHSDYNVGPDNSLAMTLRFKQRPFSHNRDPGSGQHLSYGISPPLAITGSVNVDHSNENQELCAMAKDMTNQFDEILKGTTDGSRSIQPSQSTAQCFESATHERLEESMKTQMKLMDLEQRLRMELMLKQQSSYRAVSANACSADPEPQHKKKEESYPVLPLHQPSEVFQQNPLWNATKTNQADFPIQEVFSTIIVGQTCSRCGKNRYFADSGSLYLVCCSCLLGHGANTDYEMQLILLTHQNEKRLRIENRPKENLEFTTKNDLGHGNSDEGSAPVLEIWQRLPYTIDQGLTDYEKQLRWLEKQNKKRLMAARKEKGRAKLGRDLRS